MDNDEIIALRLVFSDEATLHTRGKANRHNLPKALNGINDL
jgi:hypothetical protein